MREMINSGQEWLGNIPANWDIAKIDSLYKLRNTKVSDYEYEPLSVTMSGVVPQLENAAKTNAHDDRKLVLRGDFAINSRSDRRGSCGISEYDGSVSLINTVLKPKGDMVPRYFNWLFHTKSFADEFYRWGHGIVDDLWTTNWQDMRKIVVSVPSMPEQKRIASFLDSKCSEIDYITTDIRKEIETLQEYRKSMITEAITKGLDPNVEMKDSGIVWIGMIPKHWEVNKIKYNLHREDLKNPGEMPVLSLYRDYGVIPKDSRDDNHNVTSEDISKYKYVKKGSFVINKMKAWQGSVAVSEYQGVVSPAYYVYKFDSSTINKDYFHYLMRSCYKDEFRRLSGGIREGQWDLASEDLDNTLIIIPPLNEQKQIVLYIDSKCYEIDSIIEDKQNQLATLAEYRKSLIYEYVTGKKEVPAV